jgi:DNA-binding transcriptional ArsR family regulator
METETLEPIWKALADPTRRRILDALRLAPQTTGQLCEPFKLSRFAIMKHLAILAKAGLVVVRPLGRERWNHLNPVPIQQIYERWVRSYEALWAKSLLDLRDHIEERKAEVPMSSNPLTQATFGVAQIELEIPIKAKLARVWEALVRETSHWWRKDFYTSPATKGFVIEPRLGGHAYEDCGEGAGQIWYTVIGVHPQTSIMLLGLLTPAFGGPAQTILQLTLKTSGKNTTLQLSDTIFGKVSDDKLAQTREGWMMLFDGGLRAFLEAP